MTDQLMDNLTNEEHEELLLMSEHAIAPPLSAAADAVLDAYMANCGWLDGPLEKDYRCAAAVLRAAALYCKRDAAILLSIADELEALPD
jgi:hypothetical protein